jgi:hypothetical protein
MTNALVVHKDRLPQSQKMHRAAQYVRMSTNYQCYSIANQAAVIAAYAQMHGLTIVCTYRDEGESGLKIKNRMGLTQLIEDIRSGHTDFGSALVLATPHADQSDKLAPPHGCNQSRCLASVGRLQALQ